MIALSPIPYALFPIGFDVRRRERHPWGGIYRRLSQTLARGITKAGVATEMVDLLSADTQELVEIVGRNSGLVIMAPPSDATEAQASIATVLSAVNPKKQKV